jgi:hypothetical protein
MDYMTVSAIIMRYITDNLADIWSECSIKPEPSHVKAVKGSSFTIWVGRATKNFNSVSLIETKDSDKAILDLIFVTRVHQMIDRQSY